MVEDLATFDRPEPFERVEPLEPLEPLSRPSGHSLNLRYKCMLLHRRQEEAREEKKDPARI